MIKTVQPQRYGEPERGQLDHIYLEAHSPVYNEKTVMSPETFQPTVRFSVSMYRYIDGKFVFWKKNDAIYRLETWYSKFGSMTANQFKQNINMNMIAEILYVNDRTRNESWNGSEIQQASYWHETITQASDFEVVTPIWDTNNKRWML